MQIKIVKAPVKLMMIKPSSNYNLNNKKPLSYSVKTLTPLMRNQRMVQLNHEQSGMISITDNYFDFHESHHKPDTFSNEEVLKKVMDDKLMEYKFAYKLN